MVDEDAGQSAGGERTGGARDRRGGTDDRDDAGLGFSLPPISLPEMRLPERVRLVFPVPEPPEKVTKPVRVEASWVLLAVILADGLDAFAVAWAGPGTLAWARAAVGLLAGVVLVGGPGLLYAWELVAILAGMGTLSLAPTLTVLVLARLVFAR